LLAKSLPGLCPHVEQGDDGASSRVQNDFANNINNSDVLHELAELAGHSVLFSRAQSTTSRSPKVLLAPKHWCNSLAWGRRWM